MQRTIAVSSAIWQLIWVVTMSTVVRGDEDTEYEERVGPPERQLGRGPTAQYFDNAKSSKLVGSLSNVAFCLVVHNQLSF